MKPVSTNQVRRRARELLALLVVVTALGCSKTSIGAYPGLEQRVFSYYRNEQAQNWEETYKFRTPAFRESVPRQNYIDTMQKDNAGWNLVSFSIISIHEKDGKVEVSMKFVERMPSSAIPPSVAQVRKAPIGAPMEIEELDTTVWKMIGGEWYCYDAATRGHLSMNATLVSE